MVFCLQHNSIRVFMPVNWDFKKVLCLSFNQYDLSNPERFFNSKLNSVHSSCNFTQVSDFCSILSTHHFFCLCHSDCANSTAIKTCGWIPSTEHINSFASNGRWRWLHWEKIQQDHWAPLINLFDSSTRVHHLFHCKSEHLHSTKHIIKFYSNTAQELSVFNFWKHIRWLFHS